MIMSQFKAGFKHMMTKVNNKKFMKEIKKIQNK